MVTKRITKAWAIYDRARGQLSVMEKLHSKIEQLGYFVEAEISLDASSKLTVDGVGDEASAIGLFDVLSDEIASPTLAFAGMTKTSDYFGDRVTYAGTYAGPLGKIVVSIRVETKRGES
jgi:hypothetical protein